MKSEKYFYKHKKRYTLRKLSKYLGRKGTRKITDKKPIYREPKFTLIPKGTILWRTQPVSCKDTKVKLDRDTGKTGFYLATNSLIPLGMILEYQKPMKLCKYRLNTDIYAGLGKYSYRHLNPHRHYDRDYHFQSTDIKLLPEENISHFDPTAMPLHHSLTHINPLFGYTDVEYGAELFITNTDDLESISEENLSVKQAESRIRYFVNKNKKKTKKTKKK